MRSAALVILLLIAVPAPGQGCVADCDGNGAVGVNELIACVNRGIGLSGECAACDADGDGSVAINELIAGVNGALAGCPVVEGADLVPVSVRLRSDTPPCITDTSEIRLGVEVCVRNAGALPAGPFLVRLIGEDLARLDGLAAGAVRCLRGPFLPFEVDVLVDAAGEVAESDEDNNFGVFFVPQPTPPPFCVDTPTPTETPTELATPTGTPAGTAAAVVGTPAR